jgi:hypothetical protein
MIKIKQFNDYADRPEGGPWYSDNKTFEQALNTIATPELIRVYYPDLQEALVGLVKEFFDGVEVLEISVRTEPVTIHDEDIF